MVDPPKPTGGQGMQSSGSQTEEVRGLHHVLLRQQGLETLEERGPLRPIRFRREVDLEVGVAVGPGSAPPIRPRTGDRLVEDRDRSHEPGGREGRRWGTGRRHGKGRGENGEEPFASLSRPEPRGPDGGSAPSGSERLLPQRNSGVGARYDVATPLSYVGIRVTDLESSVRLYTQGLGLKERKRGTRSHGGAWVSLVDPESHGELELNWYPEDSPYRTPYVVGEGLDHLGFDTTDARAKVREFITLGGQLAVEPWIEKPKSVIGFAQDPDGIWIEVRSPID